MFWRLEKNMEAHANENAQKQAVGATLIIPVAALLFAVYYVVSIWELPWEAQLNGFFLSAVLTILVAAFLFKTIKALCRGKADLGFDSVVDSPQLLRLRLGLIIFTIGFVFIISWIGFTATTFLFLVLTMRYLGVRSWKRLITVSGIISGAGYLLFIVGFKATFPRGIVENVLAVIFG